MQLLSELLEAFELFIINNGWFAPMSSFLLPFIEAIIPSLPLTALIAFNLNIMATTYGAVPGTILTIILSTLGSFSGMFLIYILLNRTLGIWFEKRSKDHPFEARFVNIVNDKNIFFVFLFLANPFFPSSIMNYTLSVTKISTIKYVILTLLSRLVIVIFLVFLGSIFDLQNQPLNLLWVMLAYGFIFACIYLYNKVSKTKKMKQE